jgi:uncharacterized protein YyaL (SSP411 family)
MSRRKNRLADETSPYLLQHAHNPVNWQPWDERALEEARREDKPIFLSIGYSACHWCHVMERESFENEDIAAIVNEHFVPIKVDREERPDVDNIYMSAVQMMTGQGGWPMSVWLTPGLEPFYAGTYFPPENRWGRPGFSSVLTQLADAWKLDRASVDRIAEGIGERLVLAETSSKGAGALAAEIPLTRAPITRACRQLERQFDGRNGGFADAPKFPPTEQLRLLLHVWCDEESSESMEKTRREHALDMVENTLLRMASGGIYDQLGGGFHRYSVDARWLIPHFEKMLYDNALLAVAYVEAWQATGRAFYRRIACETLDYALREMLGDFGDGKRAFYATQDADSEGEEGKFFVWTPQELAEVLGEEDARAAAEYWGVDETGNFEHGASALHRLHHLDGLNRENKDLDERAFARRPDTIEAIRKRLFEAREKRVRPGCDTKVVAAWNGMMISAMARAGFAFDDPRYLEAAEACADFILSQMLEGELPTEPGEKSDFQLMRIFKDGRARFPGYLDDFAWVSAGLIDLFESTGDPRRLEQAEAIADRMIALFADEEKGGFFYTAEQHKDLIVRQKESYDGATPSGNSIALTSLLRLSVLRARPELRDRAEQGFRHFRDSLEKIPTGMSAMLQALDFHLLGPAEVVLVEPQKSSPIRDVVRTTYVPNSVRVLVDPEDDRLEELVPLAQDRPALDDEPTAYVCYEGACRRPTTDAEELRDELS